MPSLSLGTAVRGLFLLVFLAVPVYVGLAHFAAIEPYLFPLHMAQSDIRHVGAQVHGPYPDRKLLATLKSNGYRAVISLLDGRIPYERSLIEAEREAARSMGLAFVELRRRKDGTLEPADDMELHGRIYIHSYFGRHDTLGVLAEPDPNR
ncbi:MAG: hypothetical protein RLZZ393_2302 [Pseudomonadota bacterium]